MDDVTRWDTDREGEEYITPIGTFVTYEDYAVLRRVT